MWNARQTGISQVNANGLVYATETAWRVGVHAARMGGYGVSLVHTRNWWAFLIRGIVAILFGLLAIFATRLALFALVLFFGAYALVDGIFAIVAAIRRIENHERWGILLLEGVIGVIIGLVTFFVPSVTLLFLAYLIAIWALLTGIAEIIEAIRLRAVIRNEWLLILSGVLSVVFGVIMFFVPGAGLLAVTLIIGIFAIIFGVVEIGLAFRLRAMEHHGMTTAAV
jgi:uncharacterized membrane protein HdeD (DUF308 family)